MLENPRRRSGSYKRGGYRYRHHVYFDHTQQAWVWTLFFRPLESQSQFLVTTGVDDSEGAAIDAARRAQEVDEAHRFGVRHNPPSPCHSNPAMNLAEHGIADLPWRKASHAAGFYVWWTPITARRAGALARELVGKKLPRPGFEMSLGELPEFLGGSLPQRISPAATLWLENAGGKYILKAL